MGQQCHDRAGSVAATSPSTAPSSGGVTRPVPVAALGIDQLQTDQGPCVDCFHTGQPVSVADLPSVDTDPVLARAARYW
jgi:hypothetical protein